MYVRTYVRTYVCTYACMYVCVHVRMYIYICTYIHVIWLEFPNSLTKHQEAIAPQDASSSSSVTLQGAPLEQLSLRLRSLIQVTII